MHFNAAFVALLLPCSIFGASLLPRTSTVTINFDKLTPAPLGGVTLVGQTEGLDFPAYAVAAPNGVGPVAPSPSNIISTSFRPQVLSGITRLNPLIDTPYFTVKYPKSPYSTFDLLKLRTACIAATAVPTVTVTLNCTLRFVGVQKSGAEKPAVDYTYTAKQGYSNFDTVNFENALKGVEYVRLELISSVLPGSAGFVAAAVLFDNLEVVFH